MEVYSRTLGKRVRELAILIVEFGLCGSYRNRRQHQERPQDASEQARQMGMDGHGLLPSSYSSLFEPDR